MPSAIRFNQFQIDNSRCNYRADSGVLTVTAIARCPGVLTYRSATGVRRELVSPTFLRRMDDAGMPLLAKMAGIPVTNEHPPQLLRQDAGAIAQYGVGKTTPKIHVYKDGRAEVTFEVDDAQTIDDIRSKRKRGVSLGYMCDTEFTPGVFEGQRFDCIQTEPFESDHLAVCTSPRAKEAVITRFDSSSGHLDIGWSEDERADADELFEFVLLTGESIRIPEELYTILRTQGRGKTDCGCGGKK
jgi:hypothetical protein